MNNMSSYCGLVDAKIRASDKDLPVAAMLETQFYVLNIVKLCPHHKYHNQQPI